MPTTTMDRILAVGTLVTLAVLVAMLATNWGTFSGSAAAVTAKAANPAQRETPTAPDARAAVLKDERSTVTGPATTPAAATPALSVAATRGASWLEVRAGGADGEELYFGMLEADDTAEFDELPVWVRLGAAETVDLRLDGVQLEPVPADESGVVEILADADGIRPARPTAP